MKRPTAGFLAILVVLAAWPVAALSGPMGVDDRSVGGDILLSPGADNQSWPDMVYNDDDDQWLVVWQDMRDGDWDIYGQIVDSSGRIIDGLIRVAEDEEDLRRPAVAFDTTLGRYFVVWQKEGARPAIEGQILDAEGERAGGVVSITDGLDARTLPDVAYDPVTNEYLVVWEVEKSADNDNHDISGRKVSVDGTVAPGGSKAIRATVGVDEITPALVAYPSADHSGVQYLLVWSHNKGGVNYNVVGQRLLGDGTPTGNVFKIGGVFGEGAGDRQYPDVVLDTENDRAFVVWESVAADGDHDIYGRLVDIANTPPGGASLAICVDEGDQRYPGVSYNGEGEFLVVWDNIYNMYGRRIAADGTAAGDQIAISNTEGSQNVEVYGAVAYGTDRYLVAWTDNRTGQSDIVGQYLDPEGKLLGYEVGLSVSDAARFDLAMAYGTGQQQWLAVWYDQGHGPWRIRGQRVDREGLLVGLPISITPSGFYDFTPAVAYNPDADEFLVVFERRGTQSDLLGQRVDAATGLLEVPLIQITNDTYLQKSPALAYNSYAGQYMVVWSDNRDDDGSDSDWNIYGLRLNQDGTVYDTAAFAVCARPNNQGFPDVAFSPSQGEDGQYLVVWEDGSLEGWGIAGQRVKGGAPRMAGPNFDISLDPNDQAEPSVASNAANGEFLVVWIDDRDAPGEDIPAVYGRRLSVTGGLLGSGDIAIDTGAYAHWDPSVSFDASQDRYYVVWADDREGEASDRDIYEQAISASGRLLSSGNEAVAVYPGWQWGPASASDPADGLRLVVWLDGRSQDFFDIPQVYGVLREPEPAEAGFDVFLPLVLKVE